MIITVGGKIKSKETINLLVNDFSSLTDNVY